MPIDISGSQSLNAIYERLANQRGDAFVNALSSELARLSARVEQLESAVRSYDHAFALREASVIADALPQRLARVREVSILPEHYFEPSIQLHKFERYGDAAGYRWSGPGNVLRFSLPLDRSVPLKLNLSLMINDKISNWAPLVISVDGVEVAKTATNVAVMEVQIDALPEGQDRAFTEIEISVRETVKAGPNDDRLIGFAFRGLRISNA